MLQRKLQDYDWTTGPAPRYYPDRRFFYYKIDLDPKPWFLGPISNAFIRIITEEPKRYTCMTQAAPRVSIALQRNAEFMGHAHAFARENNWDVTDERMVNRLILAYIREARDAPFYRSPHGTAKIKELINQQHPMPGSPEDVELVYAHLQEVLRTNGSKFQTPQSADAAVSISLRDAGATHLIYPKVRKIINWIAKTDYQSFEPLLLDVNPDARDPDESEGRIETTFSRSATATGSFGSTQAPRRRERSLRSLDKNKKFHK